MSESNNIHPRRLSAGAADNSRPRRTERAHRGKPDFYSPSDYENPFRRQRKRTGSSESEQKKKKGRPKGSFKTLKFDVSKQDDESSRDDDENIESPEVFKDDTSIKLTRSTTPESPVEKPESPYTVEEENIVSNPKTVAQIEAKTPKHLHLCLSKDMALIKDKHKDDTNGKDNKQTDLYSTLTPEKTLQCAIILAEINRKFVCQNFKPL